jgi:hypothetical protein
MFDRDQTNQQNPCYCLLKTTVSGMPQQALPGFRAAFLRNINCRSQKLLLIRRQGNFPQMQQRLAALSPQSQLCTAPSVYQGGFSL